MASDAKRLPIDKMTMERNESTICAIASATGEGAVGVVRISGLAALPLLRRATGAGSGSRDGALTPRQMHLRQVIHPETEEPIDQVLVCYMPGPRSYTGEDVVEVYGHGGALNLQRLLETFLAAGKQENVRLAEPGEFTKRAFLRGRLDLAQAEAVSEIIAARSERALRNAQAILAGALGQRVRALRAKLVEIAADLEACIDFAEELEAPIRVEDLHVRQVALRDALNELAASYAQGKRLNGVAIGLVGPVNAGKSSLLNAMLGRERVLVSAQPGTTRDYVEADVTWQGLAVTLIDTAGIRPAGGETPLETSGHALGAARLQECDVVVAVVDLAQEAAISAALVGLALSPTLIAANKIDLLDAAVVAQRSAALAQQTGLAVHAVSAATGEGIDTLRATLLAAILPEHTGQLGAGEGWETVQVTRERQWAELRCAADALQESLSASAEGSGPELVVEHLRTALLALGQITGETFTDDLLDSIFSRFCIGK